jgi:hypothetical protein
MAVDAVRIFMDHFVLLQQHGTSKLLTTHRQTQ